MARNGINALILHNRMISQARSRARSQNASIGAIRAASTNSNQNSRASAIKKAANKQKYSGLNKADVSSKENYTSIKKAAESLQNRTKTLLNQPEKEWENLTEEEIAKYKDSVIKEVPNMIEDYNLMMRKMSEEGGNVNKIYLKQMKSYFDNAKSKLEGLGITQRNDGTLALNQELLKAADAKQIKEVLGSTGSFVDDIGKRAANVIANADTNLAVLNRSQYAGNYTYNQYGSDIFDTLLGGGKYNAKG